MMSKKAQLLLDFCHLLWMKSYSKVITKKTVARKHLTMN